MKVHHVGYIVDNLANAMNEFEKLGYKRVGEPVYDQVRDIYVVFVNNDGVMVELVMPKSRNSVIYKLAGKYRNMPYHICYETDCLEDDIEQLTKRGYMLIRKPEAASAISNNRVAFLMHLDVGIIELVEKKVINYERECCSEKGQL